MTAMTRRPAVVMLWVLVLGLIAAERTTAQPAPAARAVVPLSAAPEAMSSMFAGLESGDRTISIAGAQWLQLRFSEFELRDGNLTIRSADDEQTFTQEQLEAWEGLTAAFNGSEVTISLTPGASGEISAEVGDVIVGLPGPTSEVGVEAAGQALIDLLGADLQRFIPADTMREPDRTGLEEAEQFVPEAICGTVDDRVASNHPASGRIMPIGCTGWIIQGGRLLTAGHCIGAGTETVEFNVPPSAANGTTVSPPVRDQYRVISSSIVVEYTGVGNDWAVFEVLPNTQTGLMPIDAQGGAFTVSDTANPNTVRITGFGVDGPGPDFGNPPPRNADNQTQQTHNGTLTQNTGGPHTGTLQYTVDTQGGNSGSPVIVDGSNVTIGIHTNGGCTTTGGANAGTSFRNQALMAAIQGTTVTLVDTNPRRLGNGETTQVVATVAQGGAPLPGVSVSFSSANTMLATVAPSSAVTDTNGRASATVTSRTNSRDSVVITADAANAQPGQVTVRVPDLSLAGFGLLLLALLFFATALSRRPA
jgi:hypothetical protein